VCFSNICLVPPPVPFKKIYVWFLIIYLKKTVVLLFKIKMKEMML
jgi:hypothetical protein